MTNADKSYGATNVEHQLPNSNSNNKDLDELERGQFGHYHSKNNSGVPKGLHFPHPLHGHPPFLNPYRVPNFAQAPSKIKSQSHAFGVPFYHIPPHAINPIQEFKYHKQMRKRYTALRRRAGVERRIKITAYISVVILAIVILIVVGAVLAVFFHVNPGFLQDMMRINLDSTNQGQDEVADDFASHFVEIR